MLELNYRRYKNEKIYSIPLFAILGIAMVSAVVVGYYAMFLTTFYS